MRKFCPNTPLKLFLLLLALLTLAVFGCSAQKKPAPSKQPAKLIPSESNIGFTEVGESQVPANVKNIISAMTGTQTATWAAVGNNNYVILNLEDDSENVKVSEVIQRVPNQNFVWLDVKLVESDLQEDQKTGRPSQIKVYKLAKTDKAVNGVGFEYKETEEAKPEAAAQNQPSPAPAPQTTPALPPTKDVEPVQPVKPLPMKRQPAPSDQTSPGRQQPSNQSPGETDNLDQGTNQQ